MWSSCPQWGRVHPVGCRWRVRCPVRPAAARRPRRRRRLPRRALAFLPPWRSASWAVVVVNRSSNSRTGYRRDPAGQVRRHLAGRRRGLALPPGQRGRQAHDDLQGLVGGGQLGQPVQVAAAAPDDRRAGWPARRPGRCGPPRRGPSPRPRPAARPASPQQTPGQGARAEATVQARDTQDSMAITLPAGLGAVPQSIHEPHAKAASMRPRCRPGRAARRRPGPRPACRRRHRRAPARPARPASRRPGPRSRAASLTATTTTGRSAGTPTTTTTAGPVGGHPAADVQGQLADVVGVGAVRRPVRDEGHAAHVFRAGRPGRPPPRAAGPTAARCSSRSASRSRVTSAETRSGSSSRRRLELLAQLADQDALPGQEAEGVDADQRFDAADARTRSRLRRAA